jgi:prevent-host-death family protein
MSVKFSEDIVPLTDMKINPGKVVKRTNESHRPILLTSRGRGVAVMQSLDDFEQAEEEKAFMRAVVEGLNDLDNKREISLEAAKKRLGMK